MTCSLQVGRSILEHYSNSLITALVHVYPDIGLDVEKFSKLPSINTILLSSLML